MNMFKIVLGSPFAHMEFTSETLRNNKLNVFFHKERFVNNILVILSANKHLNPIQTTLKQSQ